MVISFGFSFFIHFKAPVEAPAQLETA
jgi:hypothetical protein